MIYEGLWKVLEDLLTELQEGGSDTIRDNWGPRSAKTLIQILKADPTHTESLPEIEVYWEELKLT